MISTMKSLANRLFLVGLFLVLFCFVLAARLRAADEPKLSPLPAPVSNNAVAISHDQGGPKIFSFMGIGPKKTWAELGFDLSIHSATKYLNGHTDIVAGAVIGKRELVERITRKLNHLGGALDPHACFLLSRGMKTLAVRVRYQNESALKIARFLEEHPRVAKVNYPGLEGHTNHLRACELFDGFGGVLSFELAGGVEAAESFIANATIPISAPSLGGVETLMTRPATTSHAGMSAADRAAAGIADGLVRLSIGLETTDDLIEDFERGLRA